MKVKELRAKTMKDLEKQSMELRTKLAEKKRELAMGSLSNVREVRHLSKDFARVLTLQREKATAQTEEKEK